MTVKELLTSIQIYPIKVVIKYTDNKYGRKATEEYVVASAYWQEKYFGPRLDLSVDSWKIENVRDGIPNDTPILTIISNDTIDEDCDEEYRTDVLVFEVYTFEDGRQMKDNLQVLFNVTLDVAQAFCDKLNHLSSSTEFQFYDLNKALEEHCNNKTEYTDEDML